ncbi:MAG TPA: DUF4136 domain-containing protein [Sphingomonadaceae bacterium]
MNHDTHSLPRRLLMAAAPFLLLALAACATTFNSNVTRFQSQLPPPQGQTFAVVAGDPSLSGGIEFGQYAQLVAAQLEKYGYRQAASPADADMIVRFDYGVDSGRERVARTGFGYDPFWSPWYGYRPVVWAGRHHAHVAYVPFQPWGWGWNEPWFDDGIDSYTVYTSGIGLKIDRKADGQRLFEGRAQAVSTSNRLQYLVPNLIEAMFTNFPGNSGETERISVAPEKTASRPAR